MLQKTRKYVPKYKSPRSGKRALVGTSECLHAVCLSPYRGDFNLNVFASYVGQNAWLKTIEINFDRL